MGSDSREAGRLCRTYIHFLFGLCTVAAFVLALVAGYDLHHWRALLGLSLVWGGVWCVNALMLPRLLSRYVCYLHTYGTKAKARVLRKHRVISLGVPLVSVQLLQAQRSKAQRVWCLALPSQFRCCRVGDEVAVMYSGDAARCSLVTACLSAQAADTASSLQGGQVAAPQATSDVKAGIADVLSVLDASMYALRAVGWGSAVVFAIGTFVLLPHLLSQVWLGLVLWAFGYFVLLAAVYTAWARAAVRRAKQRFDRVFPRGSASRAEALRLLAQTSNLSWTLRVLAAELGCSKLDAAER